MLGSRRSRAPGPFQPRFADLSTTDDRTVWGVAEARGPATVAALIAFVSFRRLLSGRQLKLQDGVRVSRPAVLGPALLLRTMRSALPLVLRVAPTDTVALWLVRPIAHPRVVPGLLRVPGLRHGSYDGRTRLVRGPVSRRSCKGQGGTAARCTEVVAPGSKSQKSPRDSVTPHLDSHLRRSEGV
ncbi:DUF6328 family protein [Streptomyces parvus]|uniref:DUF6328 family protein n=1 Tax=Streptomyces parvus TaxID=66428 RepID=UPI003824A73E